MFPTVIRIIYVHMQTRVVRLRCAWRASDIAYMITVITSNRQADVLQLIGVDADVDANADVCWVCLGVT